VLNSLTNLSVGKKLIGGFGLVLLLTLGVAGTGFVAVDEILGRARQIEQLSSVNASILAARGAERDYALTRQSSSAEALHGSLQQLNQKLAGLTTSSDAAERAYLTRIRQGADEYAQKFDRYMQLIERGVALRTRMQSRGVRVHRAGHVRRGTGAAAGGRSAQGKRSADRRRGDFGPDQADPGHAYPGECLRCQQLG